MRIFSLSPFFSDYSRNFVDGASACLKYSCGDRETACFLGSGPSEEGLSNSGVLVWTHGYTLSISNHNILLPTAWSWLSWPLLMALQCPKRGVKHHGKVSRLCSDCLPQPHSLHPATSQIRMLIRSITGFVLRAHTWKGFKFCFPSF